MNSSDYRKVARQKRSEAKQLLRTGHYSGSYYLSGISLECTLKAVVAKRIAHSGEVPERDFVGKFYNHNLKELLNLARLEEELRARASAESRFGVNWNTASSWDVNRRYDHSTSRAICKDYYKALTEHNNGVLAWLRKFL